MKLIKFSIIILTFISVNSSCQNSEKSNSLAYEIAYTSKESGDPEIYLTDSDAKSKIRITNHPGNDGYVAWAPDGKRIASYAYHDERKTWSIHTMNLDGINRKRLTHAKNKWDSSPTWSPDGGKIAFARGYKDSIGEWQEEIWIMNSDGSGQKQIKALDGGGPFFTLDGRLLFHSITKFSEICIADIDGRNLVKLTNNNAEDWHPELSPDGKHVAFMSDRDGNREIYSMNIDGSNQQRLTSTDAEEWYPSWSPDGSKLIFSTYEESDEKHIYMMNKDGSSIRKIVEHASNPSWLKIHK